MPSRRRCHPDFRRPLVRPRPASPALGTHWHRRNEAARSRGRFRTQENAGIRDVAARRLHRPVMNARRKGTMISILARRAGCRSLTRVAVFATHSVYAEDSVSLALDWVVNGTHSGYYVAREKGFYKEAGLDVAISRGFGSGDTIKRVGSRSASFGVADTGAIIAARANDDVPVRIVAMIFDRATLGVIYLTESGIKNPKDLEGRAIGRTASGASVNMFPGFLKANDIDRSKIREVVVDGATFAPLLVSGKVDGVLEQSIN